MTLMTTISDLTRRLGEVENRCQGIIDATHEFENSVKSNGLLLNRKFEILRRWLLASEEEVYLEHTGRGYVCVSLTEGSGISFQWFDAEEEFVKEALYQSWGKSVVSVDELIEVIIKLEQEVTTGNWVNAVQWLNRYGKCTGQDFRKLPASSR